MSSCLIHGERMKIRQCSSSAGVHPLPPHRLHIPCPLTYPLFQTSSACQLYAVPWFQQQTLLQYRTNRVFRFRFSMSLIVSPRRLGWDSEEGGTLFSETRLATHSENTLRFGASDVQVSKQSGTVCGFFLSCLVLSCLGHVVEQSQFTEHIPYLIGFFFLSWSR